MAYVTKAGESLAGIALRQLANETRWTEIRDLNAEKYPDMLGPDYYPVGTSIELPDVDPSNISEDGEQLLKRLQQEEKARLHAEMIAKHHAEIADNITWWRTPGTQMSLINALKGPPDYDKPAGLIVEENNCVLKR